MREKAVTTLMSALGSANPSGKLNSEGEWMMVSCPLARARHNGLDLRPSFAVSIGPGLSYGSCFGCGFKGGMMALVSTSKNLGLIVSETAEGLLDFINAEELASLREQPEPHNRVQGDISSRLLLGLGQMHSYWFERGFTPEVIERWKLGFDEEGERVLIPIYDAFGVLVAIIGRDVTGLKASKYMIYPKGFAKSQYLFGEHLITGKEDAVLVVEGLLDVIKASMFLPKNIGVLSLIGASPSETQLRKLVMLAREVIEGLDSDAAGRLGAEKLRRGLLGRVRLSTIDYGEHKDADEVGSGITDLIQQRRNPLMEGFRQSFARLTHTV